MVIDQLHLAEGPARAEACRQLAEQLEAAAGVCELLHLDGWTRHFLRDAELLRLRADREEAEQ